MREGMDALGLDPSRDDVLEAEGVTKRYGRATAASEVSLTVKAGQVHGLLGPNGSGKSTILHVLTGLLRADEGSVFVGELPIDEKASRASMGFAPDDLPLPGALTGREYIDLHDSMRSRHDLDAALVLAAGLGLGDDLDKQIGQYSHGMKRKIQVIAALMHRPAVLVLDEPFRGLDPDAAAVLRHLIVSFTGGGGGVLVATHDMLRAERDCDRVTILDHGSVVATGAPRDLVESTPGASTLEDVFLTVTGRRQQNDHRSAALHDLFIKTRTEATS